MKKEKVVSIKKKKVDAADEYLEISKKYWNTRMILLNCIQDINKLQMEFSSKKEVIELQAKAQKTQKELDVLVQEMGELELKGAGIDLSKEKETKND